MARRGRGPHPVPRMSILFVIKQRMMELGLEQKDLAASAEVTESYTRYRNEIIPAVMPISLLTDFGYLKGFARFLT